MSSAEPLVVLAGRVIDVGTGDVLSDRAIVVDGDRIREVVPAADAPAQARTIDLSGRTILPGMIDCHAHLIGEMDDGQGYAYLVKRSAAQEALTGVTNARATLLGGFTTVRDVGTFHAFVDLALREAIEDGRIVGPRMMCAGAYVTCPGGGGDITGLPPDVPVPAELRVGVSTGPDEVRANVSPDLRRGRGLHQGDRHGRRPHVRHGSRESPSSPKTRSGLRSRKPRPAGAMWPPTRTARRVPTARSAPVSARSNTVA